MHSVLQSFRGKSPAFFASKHPAKYWPYTAEEESGEQLEAQEKMGAAAVLGLADFYSVSSKFDTFTHSSENESVNYIIYGFTSFDNYNEEV